MIDLNREIIIYKTGELILDIHIKDKNVWLNQKQLAEIYGASKQLISYHLNQLFSDNELDKNQVVKKFLTTSQDGKTYDVDYYNLECVIYLGTRIKSDIAKAFRKWATNILKEYSIEGSSINNERCLRCENNYLRLEQKINELEYKQNHELVFHKGDKLKGYISIKRFLETAKQSIYIIDDYFDHSFDEVLREINVSTTIITDPKNILESNEIYKVKKTKSFYDRFIFVDGVGYHLGCSLKDIGNSLTVATRLESITLSDILKFVS